MRTYCRGLFIINPTEMGKSYMGWKKKKRVELIAQRLENTFITNESEDTDINIYINKLIYLLKSRKNY